MLMPGEFADHTTAGAWHVFEKMQEDQYSVDCKGRHQDEGCDQAGHARAFE
jgi:hypothetical protein